MKNTTQTTIIRFILRELRRERKILQEEVASALGIVKSAVPKMETGYVGITVDRLIAWCTYMQVPTSEVLKVAEIYAIHFRGNGWNVYAELSENVEDDLLKAMKYRGRMISPMSQGSIMQGMVIQEGKATYSRAVNAIINN